jgi:hypothetical protein
MDERVHGRASSSLRVREGDDVSVGLTLTTVNSFGNYFERFA